MHDKEEHLFDKAFTDRAWSEMSKLLDQEMPVHAKRQRLMWLWVLGLVVLTGLGWLFGPTSNMVNSQEEGFLPVADQIEQPTEQNPATAPAISEVQTPIISSANTIKNNTTDPKKLSSIKPDPQVKLEQDLTQTPVNPEQSTLAIAKDPKAQFPLGPSDTPAVISSPSGVPDSKETEGKSSHEQLSSAEDQVESDNFLMKEQERSSLAAVALPFLRNDPKELQWPLRETPESIEFKSKVRPSASGWNWGAQASLLSAEEFQPGGWSLGVWGQRPHFFTSRLSLRLGLQFEQINLSPATFSVPKNTTLDAVNESDPTTSIPPNRQVDSVTAQEAANQLHLKVRQFQLPVSLRWRIGQKWTTFGGAQLSYRSVYTRQPSVDEQNVSFSSSDPQGFYAQVLKLDPGSAFPTENLNRLDAGVHFGVGYRLTNRLEAMMQYDHGFRNLFQGLELQAHDRKVRLSLSYRFGR